MAKIGGFSLVEVLASMAILSIAILALGALENRSLDNLHQSWVTSVAQNQLQNISEELRAKPAPALASNEVEKWQSQIKILLPQGKGQIKTGAKNTRVSLAWYEGTQHLHEVAYI